MKKVVSLLFLLSVMLFADSDKLVVGMELAYPPFEMTDKQGNSTGISVDLAKALAKSMGREVEIKNIAWDGLIPALKTGMVDVVISSMTITKEREKTVDFSDPYAKAYLTLLIAKDSPVRNIKELDQKGRVVAVKKGTTGNIYAKNRLKNAQLLVFDKESAAVMEVVQGRADAFIYDQLSNYRNWKRHPETTRVQLKPFDDHYEYWGMAFQKGSPLVAKANAFIEAYKKDGGFGKLADKYLAEVKKEFEKQGIPFFL